MAINRVTEGKKLGLWGKLKRLALTDVGALVRGFKAADIEAMERLLLEADFGVAATTDIVQMLEDAVRRGKIKNEDDLKAAVTGRIAELPPKRNHGAPSGGPIELRNDQAGRRHSLAKETALANGVLADRAIEHV